MTFEDDLKRLEPFLGSKKSLQLWRAYQMEDGEGRRDLEATVQLKLEKDLGVNPLSPDRGLSLPRKSDSVGKYVLGTVTAGNRLKYPFGLREEEFIQHIAIFGRSGAGKTNIVALLIKELCSQKKPFLIFDWKRNYRDLLAGKDPVPLEIYTVGQPVRPLHFNPLIPPPGTDSKVWLKKLIEVISTAYYLGEGVMFLLQEAIDQTYLKFGCYDRAPIPRYPTMHDVLKILQNTPAKGRRAMWLDSTLRAVQSLCFGQISDVINVSRNDSIGDLLTKNVSLELNTLAHAEKVFLIETLMIWIHHFRMLEKDRETFKHCLIIEEAHNILGASQRETVVDILLREIRELGEAIVLVDQHPSQISVPAIGNTNCTIALNMKHARDIASLAEIMHIPRDEREVLGQLPMGRAIVKIQSRYPYSFQIQIPKVEIAKGSVTDIHLKNLYHGDSSDSARESVENASSCKTEEIPPVGKEEKDKKRAQISATEETLLRDILKYPLDGVVKRYQRMEVSRRRGNHAKESLIAKKVIRTVDVPNRSGKVVLLEFTRKMQEALKRNNVTKFSQRKGGLIHCYWKESLRHAFKESGWEVTPEKAIGNGQAVDLHAELKHCKVAVEVETSNRGCENIKRLLSIDYTWIISFSVDDSVKATTQRALKREAIHGNQIIFTSPTDFEGRVRFLTKQESLPKGL